jgi:peptidyl-prolyl cis-trans isomerase C
MPNRKSNGVPGPLSFCGFAAALLVCAAFCGSPTLGAPSPTPEAPKAGGAKDPILVKIGAFSMSLSKFEALYQRLSPETRAHYEGQAGGGRRGFLHDFLQKKLIAIEAERTGVANEPDVRLSLAVARDSILYDRYVRELVEKRLGEERLRQYYDAHKNDFAVPLRVHVRHILVTPRPTKPIPNLDQDDATDEASAKAKLERIQQELKAGKSFFEVAQHLSEDRSAPTGGDLGFVEAGTLVAPLEEAAFSLKEGQISGVVAADDGYHLLDVEERQDAGVLPFDQVREEILDTLSADVGQSVDQELQSTSDQLEKSLKPEIVDSLLGPAAGVKR